MTITIKILAGMLLALLAIVRPAAAQTNADLKTCQNTAADPDDIIQACSAFIRTRRTVDGRRAPALAMSAVFSLRGYAYVRKNDLDRAIADYTQSLEINPANATANSFRGSAYFMRGEPERALADFAIAISRSKDKGVLADAYYNRGMLHLGENEFAKALPDFTQSLKNDATRPATYQARGQTYVYLGDNARATADYKDAARLIPAGRDAIEDSRVLEVHWISYLGEIQDDNDYDNWSAPPLDHLRGTSAARSGNITTGGSCADAGAHWTSVESIKTRAAFEDHLARFPNCAFSGLAAARIAALDGPVAKTCPAGQTLDGDGDCVKRKPATREARQRPKSATPQGQTAAPALDCSTPAGLFACANHALSRSPLATGQ